MSDQPSLIPVGVVKRAHGIRGGVLVRLMTDHPGRFERGRRLCVEGMPARVLVVASTRAHNDGLVVHFDGIPDRTAAETLVGRTITIERRDRRRLESEEYWPDELIGHRVVSRDGRELGSIADVVLGPQDRLVVRTKDDREVEVPFVASIVTEVGETVVVDPPEGLF